MPIAKFVEKYGLDHFDASMDAICEITKRNTGEYAIRPFLEAYPEKATAMMKKWSTDNNVHVRRLASEGMRPRLPWAKKLDMVIQNPAPLLDILENLRDDESRFVQKSVANALNDISKDNREVALKTLGRWSHNAGKHRQWIIRHALRNLLKKKDPHALKLIGK